MYWITSQIEESLYLCHTRTSHPCLYNSSNLRFITDLRKSQLSTFFLSPNWTRSWNIHSTHIPFDFTHADSSPKFLSHKIRHLYLKTEANELDSRPKVYIVPVFCFKRYGLYFWHSFNSWSAKWMNEVKGACQNIYKQQALDSEGLCVCGLFKKWWFK